MNVFRSATNQTLVAFFAICPLVLQAQNQTPLPNTPIPADQPTSGYRAADQYQPRPSGYPQNYGNSNSGANLNYYECEDSPDTCCDGTWGSMKTALIIGGAAIGGGVIGALIAGGKGHGGSDGDDGAQGVAGPTGAQGPGFLADLGQTLSFSLTSLFPASPVGSVTVTPFVTSPNGVTFEGPTITSLTAGGTISFPPIVIPDPVFGFYNFGLSIINTSTTTLAGITLNGTLVTASRDGSVTNELTPLAGVSIAPGESQVSNTYTYGPGNVP